LFKAYWRMKRYTKRDPILRSLDKFYNEEKEFEDLMSETYEDYTKLKDDRLNKRWIIRLKNSMMLSPKSVIVFLNMKSNQYLRKFLHP
jgi:hypothetical protein